MIRIMPALTLWQPWASLVAFGVKPYETRSRRPPSRLLGLRVAIHAAARTPQFGEITPEIDAAMRNATDNPLWFDLLPYGAVIATATLAEVYPAHAVPADAFGDYGAGRWAWQLTDVHRLRPPVPAKGQQMYGWPWEIPPGTELYAPNSGTPANGADD
jgi:hypothetical protein